MNIAIIDADLNYNHKHNFPNLALMKISGYYKEQNHNVSLITNYNTILNNEINYDKIYLSKVFTKTIVPTEILNMKNCVYGGTGFDIDNILPNEIEHHMPDYNLYTQWVEQQISSGKKNNFEYYKDYSIGFTTRGCFRKCEFCVNKKYDKVYLHSPLSEFVDLNKKYICLLDDNILGYQHWESIFQDLIHLNKPFQYKQGLDERLLTQKKVEILTQCKYKGHYIFAFDNIEDKDVIMSKLKLWRAHNLKQTKFYVLCGFDKNNKYDDDFWKTDIINTFERIKILMQFGCFPYIMRYEKYKNSPYYGTYVNLASWCNQPNLFYKKSYYEWCVEDNARKIRNVGDKSATLKYLDYLIETMPDVANQYMHLKFYELNDY